MNSGYKLDISKSSLLSLKAELARKHEEASKAKAQAQGNFIKPLGKPSKSTIFTRSNLGLEDRQQNDILELTEDEESKIRRSRSALEEKARIYDSLSQQTSHEKSSHYLVDFALKSADTSHLDQLEEKEDERKRLEREEEEEEARRADSDEYDVPSDPEDDWVDFTDSLGRTRRCLRRDLSRFRVLDDKLFRSLEAKKTQEDNERPDSIGPLPPGGLPAGCAAPDLLSDDMRREQQRLKWEEEEENLRSKGDIHYQDLLFDEARTHGVGYFPFARDEGVRRGQQEDLKKLRKETESKQKAALTQREKRDQLMRARLRAAHNRKRAREGLPPLGEDEELPSDKKDEPEEIEEPAPAAVPTVQKAKGPRPKPSPAIRPWDIGKEGVPVLSQAEWNEQQRKQRKQEFAPPSFYEDRQGEGRSERRDESGAERRPERRSKKRVEPRVDQDEAEDEVGPMPPPPRASPSPPGPAAPAAPPSNLGPAASAWFSVPPPSFMPPVHLPPPSMAPWPPQPVPPPAYPAPQPPPPGEEDDDDPRNRGGLFFSTKRPRHDWRAAQEEVRRPMEEEEVFTEPPPPGVSDSPPPPGVSDSPPPRAPARRKGGSEAGRVGAEIAPPPTLDYFGPSDSATERSRRSGQRGGQGRPGADDLSASISAGLQFLRKQAEDKERKRTDKGWADFV